MTYTYALLEVLQASYEEIKNKLLISGYSHAINRAGEIDMHGIALVCDEVTRGNKNIVLTPQEFKLLHFLMANKGRVLSRDAILNRVWLYSEEVDTRVVDVYIGYLRKKIDTGFSKKLIQSVRGFGYTIR